MLALMKELDSERISITKEKGAGRTFLQSYLASAKQDHIAKRAQAISLANQKIICEKPLIWLCILGVVSYCSGVVLHVILFEIFI